nr:hypothetical protein [Tanacetum cinerariifolium]
DIVLLSPKETVRAGLMTLDLVYKLQNRKKNRELNIFYTRFLSLVFEKLLGKDYVSNDLTLVKPHTITAASLQKPLTFEVLLTSHMLKVNLCSLPLGGESDEVKGYPRPNRESESALIFPCLLYTLCLHSKDDTKRLKMSVLDQHVEEKKDVEFVAMKEVDEEQSLEIPIVEQLLDKADKLKKDVYEPPESPMTQTLVTYSLKEQLPSLLSDALKDTLPQLLKDSIKSSFLKSITEELPHLFGTTFSKFSPTPPREPTPLRVPAKGKEIFIVKDQVNELVTYQEEGGSIPKIPKLKSFITSEKTLYTVNSNKEASMKIIRGDNPLNLIVHPKFRLKSLGFSEWLEAKKLGLPPPLALGTFRMTPEEKKRKRTQILKEAFVTKDIKVDGMNRNLIPPPGFVPIEGPVIKELESGIFYMNRNTDIVFQRERGDCWADSVPSTQKEYAKVLRRETQYHLKARQKTSDPIGWLYKFACKLDTLSSLLVQRDAWDWACTTLIDHVFDKCQPTFSEYMVVYVRSLIKIIPDAPLDKFCVRSCGIFMGTEDAKGARVAGASMIIGIRSYCQPQKPLGRLSLNPKDYKKPVHEVIAEMTMQELMRVWNVLARLMI